MLFLYLPDVISLVLLTVALTLLRSLAVAHCRQEIHRLRLELLLYWTSKGLYPPQPVYGNLTGQMSAGSELAEGLTPARLFLVRRKCRSISESAFRRLVPDWSQEPGLRGLHDSKSRERLRRIQLEFDISLGMFFLFGSISGWMVTGGILFNVLRRMAARKPASRTDWAFDLVEKVFSRLGRRALRLAFASHPSASCSGKKCGTSQ